MCRKVITICAVLGSLGLFPSLPPAEGRSAQAEQGGDGVLDTSATGYMQIDELPDFDLNDDFTIEVRASFDRFEGAQEIVSKNSAWDRDGFVIKWQDDRLQFIRGGPGGKVSTDRGGFTAASVAVHGLKPARMYDLAVVKTSGSVTFYLDGSALGTRKIGALVPTTGMIKVSTPWKGGYLAGQVDELRIWREARSARDIRTAARQPLNGHEDHLLALFSFAGVGSGQTVRNISRPGHFGSLFGKAVVSQPRVIPAAMPADG
jgi:hypothetical protein